MPVYNGSAYLAETLRSIQAQTVRNIRIVVIDDGSTDDTPRILSEFAAGDSRIDVITQANAGIVAALNAGLMRCSAPFVARHDADDLSDPERFERQLAYLEKDPACVAVGCMARHINDCGQKLGTLTRYKDPERADAWYAPAREPYLMHPFLMVRRAAFQAAGGYRPVLGAEDSDLYWRLRADGKLHNMRDVLGDYRMHSESVSSQSIGHGCRLALGSQMAALSAQRRAESLSDIIFTEELLAEIKKTDSLSDLYQIGCRFAAPDERGWLAVALSAKVLELCFYRPFEPTLADMRFIRRALNVHELALAQSNKRDVREAVLGTATRLMLTHEYRLAFALAGYRLLPAVMARMAFRVLLPDGLRSKVKKLTGRTVPV